MIRRGRKATATATAGKAKSEVFLLPSPAHPHPPTPASHSFPAAAPVHANMQCSGTELDSRTDQTAEPEHSANGEKREEKRDGPSRRSVRGRW